MGVSHHFPYEFGMASFSGAIWVFPKMVGSFPPNHPLKNMVFHDFHHPFWGTPIFGNGWWQLKDFFYSLPRKIITALRRKTEKQIRCYNIVVHIGNRCVSAPIDWQVFRQGFHPCKFWVKKSRRKRGTEWRL